MSLPYDMNFPDFLFFPGQDPEKSRISENFSQFDSRLIALNTKPPIYFTALCRVASRCCPLQSHI